jgi:hypothetical protein
MTTVTSKPTAASKAMTVERTSWRVLGNSLTVGSGVLNMIEIP